MQQDPNGFSPTNKNGKNSLTSSSSESSMSEDVEPFVDESQNNQTTSVLNNTD